MGLPLETETALADVFNREYQCHRPDARWEDVMRSVACEVALVLHPDDAPRRAAFIDEANYSGLFPAGQYEPCRYIARSSV